MPRVGEEGWPLRDRGRRSRLFAGDDRRGAVNGGARRTGEVAASVGGVGGG